MSLEAACVACKSLDALDIHRISAGLFAGFGTGISCVVVPAVLASSDPLPTWQRLYNSGKKVAITLILTSTGAGVYHYYNTGNRLVLVSSALAFASGPWTGIMMKSTNDQLLSKTATDGETKPLIEKWGGLQLARTLFGVGAFVTAVVLLKK